MPFDGNPNRFETKPDVFSLEGLIAWLETQEPDETYCFVRSGTCLLTRYFEAHGGENLLHMNYRGPDGTVRSLRAGPMFLVAAEAPWTYGAALTRARALLNGGGR